MFFRISSIVFYIIRLSASDSTYECGEHGKFEYCIDGIPGCVIGCHCHPGYYFDTNTKICEPNIRLSQDYRRHYLSAEPTRVQLEPMITSPPKDIVVERTTKNVIDQKVDDIARDADDLGDWLYNQFFKTIENQVMNKTNEDNLMTRRSGGNKKNLIRRSHKKHYRSRKPKRGKNNNLKKKLLRITEDDSLFDSSSAETDTDDEKSSGSSGSSGDSEENSSKNSRKGKGHGHKKIVIFNKKPRPPLPSFIFLPNMDTPFFPPIGLPPPGVPMYPMVPVPPVMGPMYPYPAMPMDGATPCPTNGNKANNGNNGNNNGNNNNNENNGNTNNNANNGNNNNSGNNGNNNNGNNGNNNNNGNNGNNNNNGNNGNNNNNGNNGNNNNNGNNGNNNNNANNGNNNNNANNGNNENGASTTTDPNVPSDDPTVTSGETPAEPPTTVPGTLRQRQIKHPLRSRPKINQRFGPRNKLLQKLRQKMIRKNKLENYFAEQYQDEPQLLDLPPDFEPNPEQMKLTIVEKPPQSHPDVDFKYLTELIHRMDPNDTTRSNPGNPVAANTLTPPNRRYYDPNQQYTLYQNPQNNTRRLPHKADDSFYSNLGRQIASMIKNIDITGEREIDVEIEQQKNQDNPVRHVFNDNGGYGSRSYWERSVRSPMRYISEFRKVSPEYSNEHLFKLEKQVEYAASTERTLSLQELERLISGMKNKRGRPNYKKTKVNYTKENAPMRSPSKISFNLNVLSKNNNVNNQPKTTKRPTTILSTIWGKNKQNLIIEDGLNNFLYSNYHRPPPKTQSNVSEKERIDNALNNVFVKPTRQQNRLADVTMTPKKMWYRPAKIKNQNSNPSLDTKNINQQNLKFPMLNPIVLKHQNVKNQYVLEKQTIPVHLQNFLTKRLNPYVKKHEPTYFYHEFHHLDYFDARK